MTGKTTTSVASREPIVGADVAHGADVSLDRLNLEQALRDFEVANRRVVDLAGRLAASDADLRDTRVRLSVAEAELALLNQYVGRLRNSALFPFLRVGARAVRKLRR